MPTSTRGSKKRPSEKRKPASRGRRGAARGGSTRPTTITNYASALRWLSEHTDHERLRLVGSQRFDAALTRLAVAVYEFFSHCG